MVLHYQLGWMIFIIYKVSLVNSQTICRRGDGRQGVCKPLEECFRQHGETEQVGSIRLCSDQINSFGNIIVCCRPTPQTIAKQKCQEWTSTCRGNHPLVANGRDALPGEFPYMVSIQLLKKHKCGGVLISPEFILTAAHCIEPQKKNSYRLILGAYNIQHGLDESQMTSILQIISYPNSHSSYYDIILLRIEKVDLDDKVRPVCLPFDEQATTVGPLTVTGWGSTDAFGSSSNILQKGFLKFESKLKCLLSYGSDFKYPFGVSRDVMCAVDELTDACQGDSGGPLLAPGSSRCFNRLLGLVSVGQSCPSSTSSQYTKISLFLRWVVDEAFGNTFIL